MNLGKLSITRLTLSDPGYFGVPGPDGGGGGAESARGPELSNYSWY